MSSDMQDLAIVFGLEYAVLTFIPTPLFHLIFTITIFTIFVFRFFPDKIPNCIYDLVLKK
ncbi:hypothetical protein [Pelosinus sp. sgz500959]|uniref:hypothetical protein n=1 Tax=Pelosinus sp. sgz500959 TaxID=3242472 RepID=UPI00366C2DB3